MSQATISLLNSCAKDLEEIRAQLPSNLQPSVTALLDDVIARLRHGEAVVGDRAALAALIRDGLAVVGHLSHAAFVIIEVVNHCRK